tara:strand:- start:2333 stop:2851 length:519 start_codon:yes stop_codon:yes gene_type:complete
MSTLYVDNLVEKSSGHGVHIPGHVVQTAQALKTDIFTTSSTSFTDITGLSVTLTPIFSTSKMLVSYHVAVGHNVQTQHTLQLVRQVSSSDTIINPVAYNQGTSMQYTGSSNAGWDREVMSYQILDSPSTTSAVNYRLRTYIFNSSYIQYINRCDNNVNATGTSTLTVQEIAQ